MSWLYVINLFYPKQQRVVHEAVVIEERQISLKCVHYQNDVFFRDSQTKHVVKNKLFIINIFERIPSQSSQNILFGFDLH